LASRSMMTGFLSFLGVVLGKMGWVVEPSLVL